MNVNWFLCSWQWVTLGQYWYQSFQEIDALSNFETIEWCHCALCESAHTWSESDAGFDWHATRNWWPDDGMGSGHDMMSSWHGHLSPNCYPDPLYHTFSAAFLILDGVHFVLSCVVPDLHRNLGKTVTNQQSNTNDINITDKWIQ